MIRRARVSPGSIDHSRLAQASENVLYVSGEESGEQVALRARRLQLDPCGGAVEAVEHAAGLEAVQEDERDRDAQDRRRHDAHAQQVADHLGAGDAQTDGHHHAAHCAGRAQPAVNQAGSPPEDRQRGGQPAGALALEPFAHRHGEHLLFRRDAHHRRAALRDRQPRGDSSQQLPGGQCPVDSLPRARRARHPQTRPRRAVDPVAHHRSHGQSRLPPPGL